MITQEQVDRILRTDRGLPVVSLYVPAEPGRTGRRAVLTRVASLLDSIRPLTEDTAIDQAARHSIGQDIETITRTISHEPHRSGAVAVFSSGGQGLYEEVWLPRSTRELIVVDDDPYVRPLTGVLDDYYRTCAVIVDKTTAQFWEHYIDDARELTVIRDRRPPKAHQRDGPAEHRVRDKADELSKRHYRRAVAELRRLFSTGGFDLLAVGGHPFEVPAFIEFLPQDLRDRLIGDFTVDRDTVTSEDVKQHVQRLVTDHAQGEQRRLADDIVEAKAAGRPSAVGLDETLWAAYLAGVKSLALDDEASEPGVVCDRDGLLARAGQTCPLCGGPMRAVPDVLDELAAAVIDDGGDVRHIEPATELRAHEAGALLRFALPTPPAGVHAPR